MDHDFLSDENINEELENEDRISRERYEAAAMLEQIFAGRGLKFSAPFECDLPIVAHGEIDGMIFAFRFRRDRGVLDVGPAPMSPALEKFASDLSTTLNRVQRALNGEMIGFREAVLLKPADMNRLFPAETVLTARVENFLGKPIAGFLDRDELVEIFTLLVEGLKKPE